MTSEELKNIIGQPEGPTLEYKFTVPPPSVVARIIAAFANSEGGWLIIGIRESTSGVEIVGLADDVPASAVIDSALARIRPRPEVNHDFVFLDKKRLYAVEVKKTSVPVVTENQSIFVRRGHTVQLATPQEVTTMAKGQLPACLKQILKHISHQGTDATEAKLILLRQYQNLALIASQSAKSICPESSDKPSKFVHGRAIIRLLFSSLADTFERYLADLLMEIHLAQPNTLKSESPLTAEEILNCQNMPEVIRLIADKKVGALPKGNSKGFSKYLKKITKIDLFSLTEQPKVDAIFEIRNLCTHTYRSGKFVGKSEMALRSGDE